MVQRGKPEARTRALEQRAGLLKAAIGAVFARPGESNMAKVPNTSADKQLTEAEKAEAAKLAEQLAAEEKAKAAAAKAKAEAEAKARQEAEEKAKVEAAAKAEAEAKAKREAAEKAAKAPALGPMATQEIRYRKKTYTPGENLPADVEDEALRELRRIDAI